jgi:aspartate aminotransferase
MTIISRRTAAASGAFDAVKTFYFNSRYSARRTDPGIADFTFGNPHEMPLDGIVAAIREGAVPQNKDWFAYKTSEKAPQAFLASEVGRELDLQFDPPLIAKKRAAVPDPRPD